MRRITTTPNDSAGEVSCANTPAPRAYICIQPTIAQISSDGIGNNIRRLHSLARETDDRSGHNRFRSKEPPASKTIEWLLVATPDETLEYYVGMHGPEDLSLDSLEGVLRGIFPDSYEFSREAFESDAILDDSIGHTKLTADEVDVPEEAESYVAGIEFSGCGERREDWQTRLTPYSDFQTTDSEARPPLTAVAETLAITDVPVVFQVLLRPKPDWTLEADLRRRKLEKGEETFLGRVVESLFVPNSPTEPVTQKQPVTPENQRRLDELDEKETRHCFSVNVRAVATASDPATASSAVGSLSTALGPIRHPAINLRRRPRGGSSWR